MKAGLVALAAGSIMGSAVASAHHGHEQFHKRDLANPSYFQYACCGTVVTTTVYGSMSAKPTSTVYVTQSPVAPVPTPIVTICPTPGTYEMPAVTVKLNRTITVVAAKPTSLTPGPNTYGGYSTTVNASTTITYPYVQVQTNGTVVTSVVKQTTYVCPSAGAYTPVEPVTTTVSTSTVMVYPVPATYTPGTYTAPATTVTATVSDYVYVCPFETYTVSSTSTVVATLTKPTTTAAVSTPAAPVVPSMPVVPSKPVVPASYYSVPAMPSLPMSSAPAPSKTPVADTKVNGKKWAMTYTPYSKSGSCKSASEVDSDLAMIAAKGFTTVRLYATDCSGLTNVGAAAKNHGLKLIMGVFIKAAGIDDARPQIADIVQWGKNGNWDLITMIVVGNEAIFNNYCSASQLAGFISEAKSAFAAGGYYGPVTTTEPVSSLLLAAPALCSVVDVIAANIEPFFDGGCVAEQAGTFVASQLAMVAAACPGKPAYNLETGWPSSGSSNGASIAGPSQQAAAMADIIDKVGDKTVIFSFDNDEWKAPGQFGVEQYFGCAGLF